MLAYFNHEYLPRDRIAVSPDDRGFLFADALYEVIRVYGGRLFRAREHMERMAYGARELAFPETDFGYLVGVSEELIRRNGLDAADAVVYLQVTRGAAPRAHPFPPEGTPPTVYAAVREYPQDPARLEAGIEAILVPDQRWARCDIKTVGLLGNVLAAQEARRRGVGEALFVRDGFVMEGSHTNFLAVIDGVVVTPPRTNYILGGITRQAVLELCRDLSIPVSERPVTHEALFGADEVAVLGTTMEVTPVVRVEGRPVGTGSPGPVTRRLQEAFRELVRS